MFGWLRRKKKRLAREQSRAVESTQGDGIIDSTLLGHVFDCSPPESDHHHDSSGGGWACEAPDPGAGFDSGGGDCGGGFD